MASDRPRWPSTDEGPLVLVVEDEGPIAETLSDIIEDAGYRAITARDGREGLELAREHRPALIITDLMMPHLDGEALIAALRADAARDGHPAPPVILTTAAGQAVLAGVAADVIMRKPFGIDEVEGHLRHFLG